MMDNLGQNIIDILDELINYVSDFLIQLVQTIFQAVIAFVNILLMPINAIINAAIPDMEQYIEQFQVVLGYVQDYGSWIISAFALPAGVFVLVVAYYTFTLGTRLSVFGVKMGIDWYNKLKP